MKTLIYLIITILLLVMIAGCKPKVDGQVVTSISKSTIRPDLDIIGLDNGGEYYVRKGVFQLGDTVQISKR